MKSDGNIRATMISSRELSAGKDSRFLLATWAALRRCFAFLLLAGLLLEGSVPAHAQLEIPGGMAYTDLSGNWHLWIQTYPLALADRRTVTVHSDGGVSTYTDTEYVMRHLFPHDDRPSYVTVTPDGSFFGSASYNWFESSNCVPRGPETLMSVSQAISGTISPSSISLTTWITHRLIEYCGGKKISTILTTLNGTGTLKSVPFPEGDWAIDFTGNLTGTYIAHSENTQFDPWGSIFITEEFTASPSVDFLLWLDRYPKTVRFLDEENEHRVVRGAVADGRSRVIVELQGVKSSAEVTIPAGDGTWVSDAALQNGVWRRTWQAPEEYGGSSGETVQGKRAIGFDIVIDGWSVTPPSFDLCRAPVVLLHGLWAADAPVWAGLKAYLKSNGFDFMNDDPYPDDRSFDQNHFVVEALVNRALEEARRQGLVAKKADVVGHSMGGVLARKYGKSRYIRKLVTIGTPHFGSPWADYLMARPWLEGVLNVFGGKSMRNGAISDLRTGLCNVPGGSLNVPTLAIAGRSSKDTFPGVAGSVFSALYSLGTLGGTLGLVTPSLWHEALFGNATTSDWVVSTRSQGGNLPITEVSGTWHLEEPGNSEVWGHVVDFLNSSSDAAGTEMVQSVQPKMAMSPSGIESQSFPASTKLEGIGGEITITAPSAGTTYSPGDTVHVRVIAPPGTTKVWIATPGSTEAIVESAPFEADITIPLEALGQAGIAVVAFGGEGFLAATSTFVSVSTSALITSLKVFPESALCLHVGETVRFAVHGTFSDGVKRDITSCQSGTVYGKKCLSAVSINANGLLTAEAPGFCLVTVQNGISRQQIPVFVETAPISLADAILVLQISAGMNRADQTVIEADVNGDGRIGIPEAIYILQKLAGLR